MRCPGLLFALALGLGACDGAKPDPGHASEDLAAAVESTEWVAAKQATTITMGDGPGTVLAGVGARAAIESPFRATVRRAHVEAGATVEAGAPLVDLVVPELVEAAGRVAAADARIAVLQPRMTRLDALRGDGLTREQDAFEVRLALAEARTARRETSSRFVAAGLDASAMARLSSDGLLTLKSPMAGIVTDVRSELGAVIEPGSGAIVRVESAKAKRVEANLPFDWPAGATALFEPTRGVPVALSFVGQAVTVDTGTGQRRIWLDLPEGSTLGPGTQGRVRVALEASPGTFLVPLTSLLLESGETSVVAREGAARIVVEVVTTLGDEAFVRGALHNGLEIARRPSRRGGGEP